MSTPIVTRPGQGPTPPAPPALENFEYAPADVVQAVDEETIAVPPLPVTTTDPVRTIELPAEAPSAFNVDLSTSVASKLLDRDPRRKRAVVVLFDTGGTSDGAFIGGSQAVANGDRGFFLPLSGPNIAAGNVTSVIFEITAMDEVWARAFTAACRCSVWVERWAS